MNNSVLIPQYVSDFRCVGTSCVDTCCSGWTVHLDKETYKKYKSADLKRPALKLRSHIESTPEGRRSTTAFGRIKMSVDGRCPFLNHDRLCEVQATFGASMLSRTCAQYPRLTGNYDGVGQRLLTPSCPEAARLMLSSRDAMKINLQTWQEMPGHASKPHLTTTAIDPDPVVQVRLRFVDFIRARGELPVWQRLSAMGLACAAFDQLTDLAERKIFVTQLEDDALLNRFVEIAGLSKIDVNNQLKLFSRLFALKEWRNVAFSEFQRSTLDEIIKLFEQRTNEGERDDETMEAHYQIGLRSLGMFLSDRSHVIENYIIHLMLTDAFPFNASSWRHAFYKVFAKFGIVRLMLAIKAACKKNELSEAEFQSCIIVFTRFYEHNPHFKKTVEQLLEQFESLSIGTIGSLIRDDCI